MKCTADLTNLTHDGDFFLDRDRLNLAHLDPSMASFDVHDDHQATLEVGGLVGSSEGPVVGRNAASVGHGGETGVKDAGETEAAEKGGLFEIDREETKDSRRDETEAAKKGGLLELDRKETKDSWRDEVCV